MGPVAVVLVAAGWGTRLAASVPKAFVLLEGQALLTRALAAAASCPDVSVIVVVAPPSHLVEAAGAVSAARIRAEVEVVVVPGGAHRGDSVSAGLAALAGHPSIILVHDAARALAPASLFAAVIEAVRAGHPAVVPGLAVVDTIKQVDAGGLVVATPARAALRAIQTPQGFSATVLLSAHHAAGAGDAVTDDAGSGDPVTDDAALVERMGVAVHVIDGDPLALKITTSEDLVLAETLLERSPA